MENTLKSTKNQKFVPDKMSDQVSKCPDIRSFGREMSDVRPLFQAVCTYVRTYVII